MRFSVRTAVPLVMAALCACGGAAVPSAAPIASPSASPSAAVITPDQKLRMERLSSVFENGTIAFAYGYAENIGDGRGITCGRVGFTTGTGDWYQVVKAYTALEPANPLAAYLSRLAQIASGPQPNPDTTGLDGMIAATAAAGTDPVMQSVQDQFVDTLIYNPALQIAGQVGATSALSVADIYDGVLTNGQGSDPDSIEAIVSAATIAAHGTPKSGVRESDWLSAFDAARRNDMLHPAYSATSAAWAAAVGRLDVYDKLIATGNWNLQGPIDTLTYGVTVP
ncbi:MAG TPA: chitosanase [Candidatus Baltobacteraceae bacterium]|nr:chitosanase [Candidatus Baltobacteraceae bacterium]